MIMSTRTPPPGPILAALSIPPDPSPSAIRAGQQVVWEYSGDPDPQRRKVPTGIIESMWSR